MSDNEHFLSRWSRRKQEAKQPEHSDDQTPADIAPADTHADIAPADTHAGQTKAVVTQAPEDSSPVKRSIEKGEVAEPFDPGSLPSIDTIEATTDIRAFLSKGVPADLTRAALRRAWSSDPAIRDFVGLSENSWDFNAPESIPGFGGPLPIEEAKRIFAQMVQSGAKAESPEQSEASSREERPGVGKETDLAQAGADVSQDDTHAFVKDEVNSEPPANTPEARQSPTIENKNEDVAVQKFHNSDDLQERSPKYAQARPLPK